MTKFKKRLIKIGIIALMPILALLLCLNNTYAYYLGSDNNLYSNNLFDINGDFTRNNVTYTIDNSVVIINRLGDVWSNLQYNFTNVEANTTYTISYHQTDDTFLYIVDNLSNVYRGDADQVGNDNDMVYTFTTTNDSNLSVVYIRFYAGSGSNTISDVMLNVGSSALPYEPYGVWYNSALYESVVYLTSLSYFLNGGVIKLTDIEGYELVSQTISIPENSTSISVTDFPTIRSYMLEHSNWIGNIVIDFNTAINSNFYMWVSNAYRDNLIVSLDNSQHWVSPPMFNPNENNEFLVVGNSIMYDRVKINMCEGYTNFTLSLLVDNFYFKDGYNEGYKQGTKEGFEGGYNTGKIDGYNTGYNDGSIENIETNGMKTLFNSILSYPVNMIRSVFNFDFMGVNIASIIMFVISVGIVIFVVRKFKE